MEQPCNHKPQALISKKQISYTYAPLSKLVSQIQKGAAQEPLGRPFKLFMLSPSLTPKPKILNPKPYKPINPKSLNTEPLKSKPLGTRNMVASHRLPGESISVSRRESSLYTPKLGLGFRVQGAGLRV